MLTNGKPGGENIAPGDVEKALELHPDIAASAVVGIPDARWGEIVGAFVLRASPESEVKSKDVKNWLRSRIAPHKVPEHIFWLGELEGVPSQMPVNASGKTLKNELSAIAVSLLQH
jgi:mevalonyl-CoA ligase